MRSKGSRNFSALGLYGAIAINLYGGIALAFWLIFKELHLPLRGLIFLWMLVFLLIFISIVEFIQEK